MGVDTDHDALKYAQSQYGSARLSFRYLDLTGGGTGEPDRFDTVVSIETMEHLPREVVEKYLGTLRAHVKPGGTVLVTTPRRTSPEWRYQGGTHRYEYSFEEFKQLVGDAFPGAKIGFQGIDEFRVEGESRLYSRLTPKVNDRTRIMVAVVEDMR